MGRTYREVRIIETLYGREIVVGAKPRRSPGRHCQECAIALVSYEPERELCDRCAQVAFTSDIEVMDLWRYAKRRRDSCGRNAIARAQVYEQFVVEAVDMLSSEREGAYRGSSEDLVAHLVYLIAEDATSGHQYEQFRAVVARLKRREEIEESGGTLKIKTLAGGVCFWPLLTPEAYPALLFVVVKIIYALSTLAVLSYPAEIAYRFIYFLSDFIL